MSLANEDFLGRIAALKPARGRVASASRGHVPEIPEGSERLAQLLGATARGNRFGEHLHLRRWFPEPSVCEAPLEALRLIAPGAPPAATDPRRWLFLDTETTGLAGGTGTYPFLVGVAWWGVAGLEVEQLFMRDHSEEHSVLAALDEHLADRNILVTFNGKSFDWPLLETRYRMTRTIAPRTPEVHLDLLHPSRNLWRIQLGSVRLAELERHVLGWNRGPDVMSELIPQIYFDFLGGGDPEPLVPVFRHNQMDLVGLAAITGRVISLLAGAESSSADALEMFGVSRICDRRGESARARGLYAKALDGELPRAADRTARAALARIAKRDGDWELATALWMDLRDMSREGVEAYEQLAIHYEHRAGDTKRAAEIVNEALAELRRARRAGTVTHAQHARYQPRLGKRLSRLQAKLARMASRVALPLSERFGA